ncbi:MAG: DUF1080 domain-containing protein [Rhodothermales bacterium]
MCLNIVSTDEFLKGTATFFYQHIIDWSLTAFLIITCSSCASNNVTDAGQLPQLVQPGPIEATTLSPVDAVVLFDGSDLSAWQKHNGSNAKWHVKDGYMQVRLFTGSIISRDSFGDVQLHVEWATPQRPIGRGQHRGNSGIKLMGRYEIQILDSYENETNPAGQAGAVYSQHPPLVNASRPAGAWQSYDIIFTRPRFGEDDALLKPAYVTVFHNGILIHDHVEIQGPTKGTRSYDLHPDRLPIELQNHRSKGRFRNIWVRDLEQIEDSK